MASTTTLTVLLGFAAVFFCLGHLEAAAKIWTSQGALASAAAGALLPAVLAAFGLTLLLLVAHVRALGRAAAAAAGAGAPGLDRERGARSHVGGPGRRSRGGCHRRLKPRR